jgi:segregation and condensation protein B
MEAKTEPGTEAVEQVGEAPAAPDPVDESRERLSSIVESVLFAAGGPVTVKQLVDILKGPRGSGPKAKEVEGALEELAEDFAPGKRGIQLVSVGGGYQLRTARENAQWVRALFREKPARLGRATMETLAIVAYKQPATRAEIEAVRGVDAEAALATLLDRRLVKIAGRKETIGRPLLYATTPDFLETFGLKDLKDLPSLKELGPIPDAEDRTTEATEGTQDQSDGGKDTAAQAAAPADPAAEADAAAGGAAIAEAAEPGGDQLEAEGGGDDPRGPGTGEWSGDDGAGDEGRPAHRSDHG